MSLKDDLKSGSVDLNSLPAGKRNRVKRFLTGDKRALRKRDKLLGLRFASEDIAAWHKKAAKHEESITEYMERVMNAAD
jgi:hypothetical protein